VGRKKKDIDGFNEKSDRSLNKLPLYTFEMCKNCTKKCKMAGIKGAVLEYCPDFHQI
jgi:hypothetical protein